MILLCIDTSSKAGSVAVLENGILLGEIYINTSKTHSQKIMTMVAKLLEESDVSKDSVEGVCVANGPGSFTGLRIGIATAKAIAHGLDIPIVEVSALKAMVLNNSTFDGLICPIMDARRSQVYNGIYKLDEGKLEIVKDDRLLDLSDLIEELDKRDEKVLFLGDGVVAHKEIIESELKAKAHFTLDNNNYQRASSVGLFAHMFIEDFKNYSEIGAFYVRRTQAEREYEEKMILNG